MTHLTANYHTHTTFCDGRNTPEEMVRSALDKGFTCIGFSGHSPVSFDPAGGMPYENTVPYRQTIEALKTAYKDRIRIY